MLGFDAARTFIYTNPVTTGAATLAASQTPVANGIKDALDVGLGAVTNGAGGGPSIARTLPGQLYQFGGTVFSIGQNLLNTNNSNTANPSLSRGTGCGGSKCF